MHISDLNWQQLARVLEHEDRAVLPLGSTEQHAYLSLSTDSILAERMAIEAAEPLGIPVFPVLAYGITPYFTGYPGTVSLRVETYLRLVEDVLNNLRRMGLRRILLVNGHGGNAPAASFAVEWMARHGDVRVKVHNWWNAPKTLEHLQRIDPVGSHASWAENFPWTRLDSSGTPGASGSGSDVAGAADADQAASNADQVASDMEQTAVPGDGSDVSLDVVAPIADRVRMSAMTPGEIRAYLGVGNMGGAYQKPDDEVLKLWATGVAETREQLEGPWE